MKKISILLAMILCCGMAQAQKSDFSNQSCIVETYIPKAECWERVNEWIALNLSSYKASVDYSSYNTGNIIVKINTKDTYNSMRSVHYGIVVPYIKFALIFECKDNECKIEMRDICYEFETGGYVNYDNIAYVNLETCQKEMEYVIDSGGKFIADEAFVLKYREESERLDKYILDMKDESLTKKERKNAEYKYKSLKNKHTVNSSVTTGIALLLHNILSSIEATIK